MSIPCRHGHEKGRVTALPLYSLQPHFHMNPATVELLRAATIQALQDKEDVAAIELMAMMSGKTAQPEVKALPQAAVEVERETVIGPAHEYTYWAQFIREKFIPFMTSNGRLRFTSHELLSWLENCQEMVLTTGDLQQHATGKLVWRNTVSGALGYLKTQGIVSAPPFGKEYLINNNQLTAGA